MELIKIIFFVLGTFFGVENSGIIAEKTNVTIDPEKHTITVTHENLFTMVQKEQDSIRVMDELYRIGNPAAGDTRYDWIEELTAYETKTLVIASDPGKEQLNASIKLIYNTKEQLKDFAVEYVTEENSYALINIPAWNIETTTGVLKDNFWYFKDEISFSLSPTTNMPEDYKKYQKGLYTYWEQVKP
ncbi:hypothetical protein [uncultured Dokdonia sp.]|uniref:hypothetical protein n=1 Tax=uncultured Dokdonia sp. TaxID=575653 RepID=UPI00262CD1DE|nr:hypothetical protein [uncultured Dokdonia sp.]